MSKDVKIAIGGLIIVATVVAAVVIPAMVQELRKGHMKSCQENLTRIDGAKEQWALDNNKSPGVLPVWDDIVEGYLKEVLKEPCGGTYVINPVGADPECSTTFPGHSLSEVARLEIRGIEL